MSDTNKQPMNKTILIGLVLVLGAVLYGVWQRNSMEQELEAIRANVADLRFKLGVTPE